MSDVRDRLKALRCAVTRLAKQAADAEERLDAIAFELAQMEQSLTGESAARTPRRDSLLATIQRDELLRRMAEAGVGSIDLKRFANDSAAVRVGGGKWFAVTARLADLVTVLSRHSESAEDGLVAWRSLNAVAALLSTKSGRLVSKHAVVQLAWRLRARLRAAGENPFLVQVSRRNGVRLALRMPAKDTRDHDPL